MQQMVITEVCHLPAISQTVLTFKTHTKLTILYYKDIYIEDYTVEGKRI